MQVGFATLGAPLPPTAPAPTQGRSLAPLGEGQMQQALIEWEASRRARVILLQAYLWALVIWFLLGCVTIKITFGARGL